MKTYLVISETDLDNLLSNLTEGVREALKDDLCTVVQRGDVHAYECDLCGIEYEWEQREDGDYWRPM